MTTQQPQFDVQLAIYDLSHGMARQLSAQFLGEQYAIDIIPHTAIIVYGREWFFGGGIQHEDPQQFRQMMGIVPVQCLSLGRTNVTRSQFEAWCQECTRSGRYTMASYDLLTRNCNNFAHDAAAEGLKLPAAGGFPDWILDVPRRFLSSPMGQMVRPMLENMQLGVGAGAGNMMGGMAAPFANAPTSNFGTSSARSVTAPSPPTAAAVAMNNPWANIPAAPSPVSKQEDSKKPAAETNRTTNTNILDSFCKPLLSTDSKTINLCVKKLVTALEATEEDTSTSEKQMLESIGEILSTSGISLSSDQVEQGCQIVLKVVQEPRTSNVTTFALMFLRVVILQSTGEQPAARKCLEWIQQQLTETAPPQATVATTEERLPSSLLGSSHAARSMVWCTLSNAASLANWWQAADNSSLLEAAALVDLSIDSQPRPEVRQAAAAFCYNWVLTMHKQQQSKNSNTTTAATVEGELSDDAVSLLCASLESIGSEPDATTRLRRLLVAARILVPVSTTTPTTTTTTEKNIAVHLQAKTLMNDLGFAEALQELTTKKGENANNTNGSGTDADKCQKLSEELLGLLQR